MDIPVDPLTGRRRVMLVKPSQVRIRASALLDGEKVSGRLVLCDETTKKIGDPVVVGGMFIGGDDPLEMEGGALAFPANSFVPLVRLKEVTVAQ